MWWCFGMIWDTKHLCWVEPNANEWKHVMGFHINSTIVFGLFKAIKHYFFNEIMDLNYFIWLINLGLAKQ